jgi:cobalt-zinc-cadmium efflux system protein
VTRENRRRAKIALCVISAFMAIELTAGILAHSLALISDAAHMVTDALALAAALVALRIAQRPPSGARTFGMRRVEVLSAEANGITLILLAAGIVYSAVGRLVHPPTVHAQTVLVIALVGAAANIAAVRVLAGARTHSIAIEGSYRHLATDLYAFLATAAAAVVILATGFERADPIASLLIAAVMFSAGFGLVRESWRIFMESAPQGLDVDAVGAALAVVDGVVEVHDLHVWEISRDFPALSAHVRVQVGADCHATTRELEALLHARFGIDHTTLQVDHVDEQLMQLQSEPHGWLAAERPPR